MKTTVEIKKMGINGEGIGYINRKVVFVKGALLGETVEVDAQQYKNKNYYFGDLIRVVQASPMRVKNPCRANKECMGCNLLHYAYPAQLKHKKDLIKESLKKYTELDRSQIKIHDIVGMNQKKEFLTQVNLPIVDFKGKVTFGIYQRETKYLTVMTHCLKHHPLINQTLLDLEEILNNTKCKTYNDKFRTGLRFIKIRVFQDKVQLIFITGKDGLKDEVVAGIKKLKYVSGLFMSINTAKYQDFEKQGYKKIFGNSKEELYVDHQKYILSVKSSLPDHIEAFEVENKIIKTMIKESQKVISLNCGNGILEMNLPQEVVTIDNKKENIEDATYNAKALGKDNIRFVYGDSLKKMVPFAKKKDYDTVIIREINRISDELKDTLRLGKVKTVIYVNSSTSMLAKDLQELSKYYKVVEIKAVDSHVYQSYVTSIVKLIKK